MKLFRAGLVPAFVLAATTALAGCGSGDAATTADPTTSATASESAAPTPTADGTAPSTAAAGEICGLLRDEEVATVLGETFSVPTGGSIGDLGADGFGGQCLWTAGATGGNLELVVWLPDSVNPPPGEAPPAGSDQLVEVENGTYGAADGFVYLVKATGSAATDPQRVAAAKALAPTVRERL